MPCSSSSKATLRAIEAKHWRTAQGLKELWAAGGYNAFPTEAVVEALLNATSDAYKEAHDMIEGVYFEDL